MKNHICLCAVLLLLSTGCSIRVTQPIAQNPITPETQKELDKLDQLIFYGGQPGQISVSGVAVRKNGDAFKLDDRLTLHQTVGKSCKETVKSEIGDHKKPELSEQIDEKKLGDGLEKNQNYINIGCKNLSGTDIQGLKEGSSFGDDSSVLYIAKKIFFCGSYNSTMSLNSYTADEIIFRNATFETSSALLVILFSANKITLEGQSKITTKRTDQLGASDAAAISFTVKNKIYGDGHLTLESLGGSCVLN